MRCRNWHIWHVRLSARTQGGGGYETKQSTIRGGWDKCLGPFDHYQAKAYGVDVWDCHNNNCYIRKDHNGGRLRPPWRRLKPSGCHPTQRTQGSIRNGQNARIEAVSILALRTLRWMESGNQALTLHDPQCRQPVYKCSSLAKQRGWVRASVRKFTWCNRASCFGSFSFYALSNFRRLCRRVQL